MSELPDTPSPIFSANASETPRRGRPRLTTDLWDHVMPTYLGATGKSRRTLTNRYHAERAAAIILRVMPESTEWVNTGPWTILSELGRIDDDALLVDMARVIIDGRFTARKAMASCRRAREAERKRPDPLTLANEIIGTINAYFDRYPNTTDEDVLSALRTAAAQVTAGRCTDTEATT